MIRYVVAGVITLGLPTCVHAGDAQTLSVERPGTDQVSTRLTVRFERSGGLRVVDAVEIPGFLKLERGQHRQYIVESRIGGTVVAVQGFDVDFEERRAGGEPDRPGRRPVDHEEFYVDLPGISLDETADLTIDVMAVQGAEIGNGGVTMSSVAGLDRSGSLKFVGRARADVALRIGRRVPR